MAGVLLLERGYIFRVLDKRDNIVIDSVDDIRDLSRRELGLVISYIWDKYGVHIRRHHDTCTRQNDVIAAWEESWCLPVVVCGD